MIEKLWVDVETTGVNHKNDTIIELAAIYKDREFHMYCLPDEYPENFELIEEITGITWDFLQKNGVSQERLYGYFVNFLDLAVDKYNKNDKIIFSAYNANFDNEFIRELFMRNNNNFIGSYFFNIKYDVMSTIAEEICSGRLIPLNNFKLSTICEHYGVKFNAHSAIEDIRATKELCEIIEHERRSI